MDGRLQQRASWVLITSLAASGEDTTTVGTEPSRSSMTGPYCLASSRRLRCGSGPIWCRLPRKGSFRGPGGRCRAGLLHLLCFLERERIPRKKSNSSMVTLAW
nr:unnamed protein product [Digitaria exilis]